VDVFAAGSEKRCQVRPHSTFQFLSNKADLPGGLASHSHTCCISKVKDFLLPIVTWQRTAADNLTFT
jgi:hypothetical protein